MHFVYSYVAHKSSKSWIILLCYCSENITQMTKTWKESIKSGFHYNFRGLLHDYPGRKQRGMVMMQWLWGLYPDLEKTSREIISLVFLKPHSPPPVTQLQQPHPKLLILFKQFTNQGLSISLNEPTGGHSHSQYYTLWKNMCQSRNLIWCFHRRTGLLFSGAPIWNSKSLFQTPAS